MREGNKESGWCVWNEDERFCGFKEIAGDSGPVFGCYRVCGGYCGCRWGLCDEGQ